MEANIYKCMINKVNKTSKKFETIKINNVLPGKENIPLAF